MYLCIEYPSSGCGSTVYNNLVVDVFLLNILWCNLIVDMYILNTLIVDTDM
jgi:hypothetical protein